MRWYKSDTMDLLAAQPEPFRSDRLRELVDKLPRLQAEIVSSVFFGGEPVAHVAARVGRSVPHVKKELRDACETLKQQVLKDHEMGSLPADDRP